MTDKNEMNTNRWNGPKYLEKCSMPDLRSAIHDTNEDISLKTSGSNITMDNCIKRTFYKDALGYSI